MQQLGTLQRVDLRDIWRSEASDFTPWLAQPQNLAVLSDALNIELELEAQEMNVGSFRADILCKDVDTDHWVLIENQLERTDHSHLGQLLTYAAGLEASVEAVVIVWIAAKFTEEHRAALDWLNETTDARCSFFGLEVELWRIGESPAAPKFNVISKPNDWSRSVGRAAKSIADGPLTDLQEQQVRYWTAFNSYLREHYPKFPQRKPWARHWLGFGIGRAGFSLSAKRVSQQTRIGIDLRIRASLANADACFNALFMQKVEIEQEFGEALNWEPLPNSKSALISLHRENTDPTNEGDWPSQFAWLGEKLDRFDRVFRQRLRALEIDELDDDAEVEAEDVS